jgi:hypothetical protein
MCRQRFLGAGVFHRFFLSYGSCPLGVSPSISRVLLSHRPIEYEYPTRLFKRICATIAMEREWNQGWTTSPKGQKSLSLQPFGNGYYLGR